jgi:hypothetical protein
MAKSAEKGMWPQNVDCAELSDAQVRLCPTIAEFAFHYSSWQPAQYAPKMRLAKDEAFPANGPNQSFGIRVLA